jgi:pimeloyl-ACP methyl ester carboxylesterase
MNTRNRADATPIQIHAVHASEKRLGNWTTARTFQIRAEHAQIMIDLRSRQIPGGDIELDLDLDRSTVKLLVAENAVIEQRDLAWTGRGKVKQTYHIPTSAGRRIRLTGQVRYGEIRVHSGGIAQLSAIASRDFLTEARRAHAEGRTPTLDDPAGSTRYQPGQTASRPMPRSSGPAPIAQPPEPRPGPLPPQEHPAQKENEMTAAQTSSPAQMTVGSVTSADGTVIGYLRLGHGPAVVVLHGSNESARSHTQLAVALADQFTVYLPDRRGRGLSGPHLPGHGIRTEIEDLQAVMAHAGARKVFGVSVSALIALQATRTTPAIAQVAVYEPALLVNTSGRYTSWVRRFDQEMAHSQVGDALITSIRGLDLAPPAFKVLPRRLLAAATNAAMRKEDAQAAAGTVTMRQLAPTLRYEGLLLAEVAGTAAAFADVPADVLLMGGDMKRPAFIRPAFESLAQTLPHVRCANFPGLDHGGSSDPGPANRGGKPDIVAPAIRSFFAQS